MSSAQLVLHHLHDIVWALLPLPTACSTSLEANTKTVREPGGMLLQPRNGTMSPQAQVKSFSCSVKFTGKQLSNNVESKI
jgi:hypothetical protein